MRDIIAEGGFSAGGVYRHFPSKDAIIAEIAIRRRASEDALMDSLHALPDPVGAIVALARTLVEALETDEGAADRRVGTQIWAEALHEPEMRGHVVAGLAVPIRHVTALVARAQELGQFDRSQSPDALARALIAAFHGTVLQKLWQPELPIEPMVTSLQALVNGLAKSGNKRRR